MLFAAVQKWETDEECQTDSNHNKQQLKPGGWGNDSEPEAEFQETVNKSKAMLKAVALAETFAKTT